MDKKVFLLGLLCLILAFTACTTKQNISLSGTIEATEVEVFSEVSGKILQVNKQEGERVLANEVVAVVDATSSTLQVSQAQANYNAAQAKLADLKVGTRAEQLQGAQAAVRQAQAKLDELKAGTRPEQLTQAEAAVRQAQARLEELKVGTRTEQIKTAGAQVKQVEATLKQAQNTLLAADNTYALKKNDLARLQALLTSGGVSQQQVDLAQNAADIALQQRNNASEQVSSTKATYEGVLSQYELLKNGSSEQSIKAAQANVEQAQAQYALLKSGATAQSIQAAQASVEQAQAQVDLLKKGATAQAIDGAAANVAQAKSAVDLAKLQVTKSQILSPVAGVWLYKNIELGKLISPGTSIGTVQQTDEYWVRVYLPQQYTAKVQLGQKVKLTCSALPDQTIEGLVIFKSPKAEYTPKNIETTQSKEENTVIPLKIKLTSQLDKVNPGMLVNIIID
ncbi:MAG: HlyD family efflux transporter periplasmic adaptor subunit [Hyphomonadaceae bacterium]|nr:HlyD family efflux transporter periplasmic adaptor subunit [Clostridia bacterium]